MQHPYNRPSRTDTGAALIDRRNLDAIRKRCPGTRIGTDRLDGDLRAVLERQ